MLEKTWAPLFYEHVFCKINEEVFAPLYCTDNGRPNFPINILLSLEIIKNLFDYTDQELIEQFYFNYQIIYALGIRNLGEVYLAERTLYEFRERLVNYTKEHPDEEELLFKQFESLTQHFIDIAEIKTNEQRMDSTFITPNIKKAGRISLVYDFLVLAIKAIPEHKRTPELNKVLEGSFKTDLLFRTKNSELDNRYQELIKLCGKALRIAKNHKETASKEVIKNLERFLTERADYDKKQKVWQPKDNKQISARSLQSAYDQDATFRNKSGNKHSGYVANLAETCSEENPVQVITDYHLDSNSKGDVVLLNKRIDKVAENTDIETLFVDGGYYSEHNTEKCKEKGVDLKYTDLTGRKPPSNKLPLSEFKINDNFEIEECPNQKKPIRSVYRNKAKATTAHFKIEECESCPLRPKCPIKLQKKHMALRASKKAIQAAKARKGVNNPEIHRALISKRAAIEGTNSALKRAQGAGKLRVRGKVKCSIQMGYKVIGHNFKQVYRAIKKIFKPKLRVKCTQI